MWCDMLIEVLTGESAHGQKIMVMRGVQHNVTCMR